MRQGKRSYQSAGKLSRMVLYALLSLTAVVFLLFFAVGFQMPYVDNPRFNAPLLTDVLLIFVALLAGCSLAAVVWAVMQRLSRSTIPMPMCSNRSASAVAASAMRRLRPPLRTG